MNVNGRNLAVLVVAVLSLAIGFLFFSPSASCVLRPNATVALPDGTAYQVQVAATEAEQERGLGGLAKLGEREGMLFLFSTPGRTTFWMKDMRFPIDILWLSQGVVIDEELNAPVPPDPSRPDKRYVPGMDADAVLELPAGAFEAHGLTNGSRLDIRLPAGYTSPAN